MEVRTLGGPHADLRAVAEQLAIPIERAFDELGGIAAAFADAAQAAADARRCPSTSDLTGLLPLADDTLDRVSLFFGTGVVVAPGLLADADRHLAWRQRSTTDEHQSLLLDLDPAGEDPYDYPQMEWFRIPRDERRRIVTGPYYDFRGAERFTMTFAVPVLDHEAFYGVSGADVPLADLEAHLLPVLRTVTRPAALLNHESRVVTANTPRFTTGTRVRVTDPAVEAEACDVIPDLGWTLLVTR